MTKLDDAVTTQPYATEAIVTGRPPRRRRDNPLRKPASSVLRHVILILMAAVMLYPVIWMVVSSLRPNDLIFREPG